MLAHASRDQQLANSTLLVPHPSSQATRSKDVKRFLTTVRPDGGGSLQRSYAGCSHTEVLYLFRLNKFGGH